MAQWKRAGPITQRSVDRNYALLRTFFHRSDMIFFVLYGLAQSRPPFLGQNPLRKLGKVNKVQGLEGIIVPYTLSRTKNERAFVPILFRKEEDIPKPPSRPSSRLGFMLKCQLISSPHCNLLSCFDVSWSRRLRHIHTRANKEEEKHKSSYLTVQSGPFSRSKKSSTILDISHCTDSQSAELIFQAATGFLVCLFTKPTI